MSHLRTGTRGALLASSLMALALFAGCSQGHRSPTEPDATAAASAAPSAVAAASHGTDNGGALALRLEIQPSRWSVSPSQSTTKVTALIQGADAGRVDLTSIVLLGSDPAAKPLAPTGVSHRGNRISAAFVEGDALRTLLKAQAGQTQTITIQVKGGTKTANLTAKVKVVGPSR